MNCRCVVVGSDGPFATSARRSLNEDLDLDDVDDGFDDDDV